MSNGEPKLEQTIGKEIPRVNVTGYAKKYGEFALRDETSIEYSEDLSFPE